MVTMLFEHSVFADHEVPAGHVERAARVIEIGKRLSEGIFADLPRGSVEAADEATLLRVHEARFLEQIAKAVPKRGMVGIDPDTFLSARGYRAALCAAGAGCNAVDAVFAGEATNAFCAVRPPGHHATRGQAMGFCIFNNVAIAARHAQAVHGIERVAIVDWDVHHGNGTQDIFWDDRSVLYCSTHQMPLFPYSGAASETGAGNLVNVPLAEGTGSDAFRAAFTETIVPALNRFAPELLILSAGFDAHRRDPLGGLQLDASDFAWATQQLGTVADRHASGRIVSMLEGGYDIEGLVESTAAHVAALMD